jgi:uncharacterized caspase-like protein
MKATRRIIIAAVLAVVVTALGADGESRIALVIGNSAYQHTSRLANPRNDAEDVGRTLQELGFETDVVVDADIDEMEDAIRRFSERLRDTPGSAGIFYYAGHAVQSDGVNYLLPVDADIASEAELRRKAIAAQEVLDYLSDARNQFNMVVLDACRDNPFAGSFRSSARGLAVTGSTPPETLVVYATDAGNVASDGEGRNSPFTEAFLMHAKTPGIDVEAMVRLVTAEVQRMTGQQQRPWRYSSVTSEFYLASAPQGAVVTTAAFPFFGRHRIWRCSIKFSPFRARKKRPPRSS